MIRARKSRGLTQGELARRVGVGQSGISKIETGAHMPLGDTLVKLCAELKLAPDDLLALAEDAADAPTAQTTSTEAA